MSALPREAGTGADGTACLLKVRRAGIPLRTHTCAGNLPNTPYPGGAGKKKTHWRYPADPDLLRAWWATASHAVRTATPTTVLQGEPLKPPNGPPNRHPNTSSAGEKRRTTSGTPPRSLLTLLKDRR